MKDIIKKMVEGFGPSGFEDSIRAAIRDEIQPLVDEIRVDAMGNLIALKKGTGHDGKKIMVAAHMDEIGAMVSYVDKKGFVRFTNLGGVVPIFEVGGRMRFENGTIGVIAMEKLEDPKKAPELEKLYVDVGATSRDDCPVNVGDVACFLQPMVELGPCLASKAMDDRVGCAIMIQALRDMKTKPAADIYFVFTTQEEVGLRGATTGAFGINPDVGIAIDVTGTGDTPEPARKMAVSIGAGPAIKIKDSGMVVTPWVKDWMIDVATAQKIPFQLEVLVGGATDAAAIQKSRAGVAAGCISIPCRYIHSPSETVSYADVLNSVKLLVGMLERPVFN
ncbi:MAG: M42 family metallopeptidase [Lentisphaeria bacterium]|nr:M42 family metallopeptidase [Lentisphaeria bacterium]